jgi:hypothetical protein
MFFARTQRQHAWKSPQYRFRRWQRQAWEGLVREAERAAGGEGEQTDEEMDEEMDEEIDEEMDGEMDVDETDQATEAAPKSTASAGPEKLTRLQKACLEFCITLLDHHITCREYDSPMVCALAVLGVKEDGWKGPEQYPPILSAVIKIARFMVVQKELELVDQQDAEDTDDDDFDDSAYESGASPSPRRQKGCLQFVKRMMDQFMVRGTHGPMEWMLDLRTYGLKIYYNTTVRGHVEWIGDELLYKELHFSMAQFRGIVHRLATESRRLLTKELLFSKGTSVPAVPWESLRDNPTNKRPGWNFLQDQRTRMPVDGEQWLFKQVRQDGRIKDQFMKPGSQLGVD